MGNTKTKITFVGDSKVGKSSLIYTYKNKAFPTSVPDVVSYNTTLQIDGKSVAAEICDSRATDLENVRAQNYLGTNIFIICFALNDPESFDNIAGKWLPEVRKVVPNSKVLLVGTKSDLRPDEEAPGMVSDARAKTLARSVNAQGFVDCSAKENEGIRSVFDVAVSIAVTAGPGEDEGVKVNTASTKLTKSSKAPKAATTTSGKQLLELLQQRQVDWRSVRSLLKGTVTDVNYIDSEDRTTALLTVCSRNEPENAPQVSTVKALLKAGADPNLLMPLRAAVSQNKPTLVQLLLAAKADPNAGSNEKPSLLWSLLSSDDSSSDDILAEALLAAGAKVTPNKWEDFVLKAIQSKRLDLALPVLKRNLAKPIYVSGGVDDADSFVKSFVWAAQQNTCEFIELLCASQKARVTKSLLNDDLPEVGLPALSLAAFSHAHEAEAALLFLGAKPNYSISATQKYPLTDLPDGASLLHFHCHHGPKWLVCELIKAGADVNDIENDDKKAPLHIACRASRRDLVKELVKAGAKLNTRDSDGKLPVDYCQGKTEITEYLEYTRYARKKSLQL